MMSVMIINLMIATYLKMRNILSIYKKDPKDNTDLIIVQKYNRDKLFFSIFSLVLSTIRDIIVIKYRIYQQIYNKWFVNMYMSEVCFFLAIINISSLLDLPLDLFNTFVIEQMYGFNNTTLTVYAVDFIKKNLIINILIFLVLNVVLNLVYKFLSSFWLYLWVFLSIFQLIMVVIYPVYIQPLFNKFDELEEGDLKDKINELSKKIGFQASKIFIMDGSKRSSHSNAYFTGLTKEKRIVLFDTLLKDLSTNEILAVLCHEFGHWFNFHIIKQISFILLQHLLYFWMTNQVLNSEYISKNLFFQNEPLIIKLMYVSFLLTILEFPMMLVNNIISRKYEREADIFAVKQNYGEDLIKGLNMLEKSNKSHQSPDWLYSMCYNSHPTVLERVDLIENEMKKHE